FVRGGRDRRRRQPARRGDRSADRRGGPLDQRAFLARGGALHHLLRDGFGAGVPSPRSFHGRRGSQDMKSDHIPAILVVIFASVIGLAFVLPQWVMFLLTIAMAKAFVVLGLVILQRTGLVSFGQA